MSNEQQSTQGQGRLSFDNLREHYPPDKYIYLLPAASKLVQSGATWWSLDVTEVKINPDNPAHAYPMKKEKRGNDYVVVEVGLTRVALDLLCAAADVQILTEETPVSIQRGDRGWRQFRACAVMNTPTGQVRGRTAHVEWDAEIMEEKVALQARRHVDMAIKKGWNGYKGLSEEERGKKIEEKFEADWLQEREFGVRKTETKAARNAAGKLLAMTGTYSVEELRNKRFAVAKFVFAPDLNDPEAKRMVLERGLDAQRQVFGQPTLPAGGGSHLLPEPSVSEVETLPVVGDENAVQVGGFKAAHSSLELPPPSGPIEDVQSEVTVEGERVEGELEERTGDLPSIDDMRSTIAKLAMFFGELKGKKQLPKEVGDAYQLAVEKEDVGMLLDLEAWAEQYKDEQRSANGGDAS